MIYEGIVNATFIKRINRFIAQVDIDGEIELVHVKNTGRCKELFIEGVTVYLERAKNPDRKTKYSLISIYKDERLINIDSQVPNQVVYDAILGGFIKEIGQVDFLKREVKYGNSRFDIYYEQGKKKGFVEVKGVTLENNGIAMFPDAPTSRGRKHLFELIEAKKEGYEAYIFFLIQMDEIIKFQTNNKTDQAFTDALELAKNEGVKVLVYNSKVTHNSIEILVTK